MNQPRLFAWLRKTLYHIECDRHRKRRPGEMPTDLPDTAPPLEHRLLDQERAAALAGCIDTLPALYRDVMRLYFYEERSYRNAAGRLSIPENTFATRIRRGLEQARDCMKRKGFGHV